jgi:hypothetical protein
MYRYTPVVRPSISINLSLVAFVCIGLPLLVACAVTPPVTPPVKPPAAVQAESPRREADEYSRYELLEPGSGRFHILFEVTAVTPGATAYFNPIRKGSVASDESVRDRATSKPLPFEVVSGEEARASGLPEADLTMSYIRIQLPHPVPPEGGVRLLIEKTYEDAKSYSRKGPDRIVFARTLGIRRNAVVLPAGYELTACNVPSQVLAEPDGRLKVSLMHTGPEAVPLVLEARQAPVPMAQGAGSEERLSERAHQDREIVYSLREPETHAFDLYHDYTESRPGVDRYLNVVRKGSAASAPSARILDTGETLKVEIQKGQAVLESGHGKDEGVEPDSEVVVIHFPPVQPGGSARLRIAETYTDPKSYRLEGDTLVFDRSFGRPRNSVILPAGWALTTSSIPAMVSETSDGRIRLDFVNPRPDEIAVLIQARRRPARPPS